MLDYLWDKILENILCLNKKKRGKLLAFPSFVILIIRLFCFKLVLRPLKPILYNLAPLSGC
jgi:hypothetical protein